ncbi:TraR/DksA C4-type zinc finger protein [Mesobacterium sp. TK19101]|uniref:TraR/DksA C4-type zinc finger protein n=1 Tax=Mesobacterium hydrothermale TaxID=3111907 RepID=A0ABU6HID9_9RHOB|nr:TraR/DksA C4-type zinc finger protein [Mesobacterium sp. TK19101]MEC3862230.1 TraR/DksA C4-type zinc finger protein [Mesobacterium sp. TK19101]
MNTSEQARFRQLILARLADLDAEDALGKDAQATVELDQQAVGRLSRQDALLAQSMARATQARRDGLRRALTAALARIDDGDFGYCDDCGEDIPVKRLELDPTATRCVSCATG